MERITPSTDQASPAFPPEQLLTKQQVAGRLQVTRRTIENLQARGVLPYVKIGKLVRFNWADVQAHLRDHFTVTRRTTLR